VAVQTLELLLKQKLKIILHLAEFLGEVLSFSELLVGDQRRSSRPCVGTPNSRRI
jgi:hypothetical protein